MPSLPFQDPDLPLEERLDDLIGRMTLEEKAGQMVSDAPAIERLGVPPYGWWNEALHGVARAGIATVFPQAIGLAAAWDADLLRDVADAISTEARAKHHQALREGSHAPYYGLTCWSPNINIFRDPRWGRGQETYGECPYLTARLGVEFVRGMQGADPQYLKTVATPKHFAVHSGPEATRHHADVDVSERDLWETYLPAFRATVEEADAESVMSAYQRFRGAPCSASTLLLHDILREEWGFAGYVVSDCGAIEDIYLHHQVAATPEEASARAVQAGCDLCCGGAYRALPEAVRQGLIEEAAVDRALARLFRARFRLGMFDPPERVPYAQIPYELNDSAPHRALALRAARESLVLLKNAGGLLPLDPARLKTVAVIGPHADNADVLLGNYFGYPSQPITPLAGLRAALEPGVEVLYAQGCALIGPGVDRRVFNERAGFAAAVEVARRADVAILVLGLSQLFEGEEGQTEAIPVGQRSQGDRTDLDLPDVQQALLQAVHATGTPIVLVLMNGSALAVRWADAHVPAILEAWYPGQAGGAALADALLGATNPGGRLPVTFYRSVDDLPPFEDYAMAHGRTYRYFTGAPLYAFGHGLSYTRFAYQELAITPTAVEAGAAVTVRVTVTNSGERAGDEVAQLYLAALDAPAPRPIRQLAGFQRVHLAPGEARTLTFEVTPEALARVDDAGRIVVEAGRFALSVGGGQPGAVPETSGLVSGAFEVTGGPVFLRG